MVAIVAVAAIIIVGLVLHVQNDHRFQDCKNGKVIFNNATRGGATFVECKHGFP